IFGCSIQPEGYSRGPLTFGWRSRMRPRHVSFGVRRNGEHMEIMVKRLMDLTPDGLAALVTESERAGWRFVRRLADEWATGANRFDQPGEALFAAWAAGRLVGVCGLNGDPYTADQKIGRLRRLYVLEGFRRAGVGRQLVQAVLAAAQGRFRSLRLRTESPE